MAASETGSETRCCSSALSARDSRASPWKVKKSKEKEEKVKEKMKESKEKGKEKKAEAA